MDNSVGRLQSLFSSHQFDVIIGSLLGDGRLECRSIGLRQPITARLRIQHSERQRDYVFWKYKQLKSLISQKPRRIKAGYDSKRNKTHFSWYFHTRTIKELGMIQKLFYHDNKKILPRNIFKMLTPRSMAIWFMDDGSDTKLSYTLNTHCFSLEEQKQISEFFRSRYSINAKIIKDREKYKIAIGRHEYDKLNRIIKSFIIPSMNYKIVTPVTT